MTQKHDFKAAFQRIQDDYNHGIIQNRTIEDHEHDISIVETALRIADRLQRGEIIDRAYGAAYDRLSEEDYVEWATTGQIVNMAFEEIRKAVSVQLIKEET